EVIGEDVGTDPRDETRGELAPVVVPAVLADAHVDIGIVLFEGLDALLVGGQLIGVPQPVVETDCVIGGGSGAVAACDGQRAGRQEGQEACPAPPGESRPAAGRWSPTWAASMRGSGAGGNVVRIVMVSSHQSPHLIPVKPMEFTMRLAKAMNSTIIGNAAMTVAAIRPAQSGPVCGVWALKLPSATVSTWDRSV